MKIYITLWLILIAAYAVFHFGFRTTGDTQLYKINDRIAFEARPDYDESLGNGVTVRGYLQTNFLTRFLCGACAVDYSEVDMPQANYIKGDWVYSGYPQHATAKTDIVNLRTGEAINVEVPGNPSSQVDLSTLLEYRERGLKADEQYKLRADYVKANFPLLSTYTNRCFWVHIAFVILALLLIFPSVFFAIIDALASDDDNIVSYTD